MRHRAILGVYLCALAVWAQLVAPAAALTMRHTVDPFSVICARQPASSREAPQPTHHKHGHDCCLACHVQAATLSVDMRPVYTTFDYPIASPLRWRPAAPAARPWCIRLGHRPRDPPALV